MAIEQIVKKLLLSGESLGGKYIMQKNLIEWPIAILIHKTSNSWDSRLDKGLLGMSFLKNSRLPIFFEITSQFVYPWRVLSGDLEGSSLEVDQQRAAADVRVAVLGLGVAEKVSGGRQRILRAFALVCVKQMRHQAEGQKCQQPTQHGPGHRGWNLQNTRESINTTCPHQQSTKKYIKNKTTTNLSTS